MLALAILAYNAGVKRTWFGPVIIGACRGLNLLLGMTHAAALGGPIAWLAAVAYGIFVCGITLSSRSEAVGGARLSLIAGLSLQLTAILALAGVGFSAHAFQTRPRIARSFRSRGCLCWPPSPLR